MRINIEFYISIEDKQKDVHRAFKKIHKLAIKDKLIVTFKGCISNYELEQYINYYKYKYPYPIGWWDNCEYKGTL